MNKILLVIPTLKRGGAERVMSILAEEFTKLNNEVHLITWANGTDGYKLHNDVVRHKLGFNSRNKIQRVLSIFITYRNLKKTIREINPDVVLSFMVKSNIITLLASSGSEIPVFVSDRSSPKRKLSFIQEFLRKYSYKKASGIIAQTSLAKEILTNKTNNSNIKIIQNPVNKIEINKNIEREKIIITVGRMIPQKGHAYFLEAFSRIKSKGWKIVILGDGKLKESLEDLSKVLKIEDFCEFPGEVNNISSWLQKSSIFAFPSISEGFPNALMEGMSSGLPCVSFNCDAGPSDIIEDGVNGYLVPTRDTDLFAERLLSLMNDEELRKTIGKEAQLVNKKFNQEKIAHRYLNFILNK